MHPSRSYIAVDISSDVISLLSDKTLCVSLLNDRSTPCLICDCVIHPVFKDLTTAKGVTV